MNKKITNNIYNDFEMYRYPEIYKNVECMMLNATKENLRKYNNTKTDIYYEVAVKLSSELNQRIYKYNTLDKALTACYYIYLLVQKEDYTTIENYYLYTTVTENGNIIIEDTTDNFHYWIFELKTQQNRITELEKQITEYEAFLQKYQAEELFEKFIKEELSA